MQAVYQIAWSPDSRLLVSGSADSTVKGIVLSHKRHPPLYYVDRFFTVNAGYEVHIGDMINGYDFSVGMPECRHRCRW